MKKVIFGLVVAIAIVGCSGGDNGSIVDDENVTVKPVTSTKKIFDESIPGIWHTFVYEKDGVIGAAYLNYELLEDGTAIQTIPYSSEKDFLLHGNMKKGDC